jgi:RHS repeat-associated protein
VTVDGVITTVAGNGNWGSAGDGGPATAAELSTVRGVAVGGDGNIYIADADNNRIRQVRPDGTILTLAGQDDWGFAGDTGPATQSVLSYPDAVAVGPNARLYLTDGNSIWPFFFGINAPRRVREMTLALPGFNDQENVIASEDGSEIYVFDALGRHLYTKDALTGVKRFEFTYDTRGLVVGIRDIDSLLTTIERDADGNPTAIVSPFGQRSVLALDPNSFLASITNPANETVQYGYSSDGLMTSLTDARGGVYRYTHEPNGRLSRNEDPAGGYTTYAREELSNGYALTVVTAEGRRTTYEVRSLSTGGVRMTNTDEAGLSTVTIDNRNGTTTTTSPDGTVTTVVNSADPRFGMQSPLSTVTVRTPGGLQSTVEQHRIITQMSGIVVTGMVDSVVINGRIYKTIYDGNVKQFTSITPEGRQSIVKIDNKGRVIQESVPGVAPVSYTYDPQGRLVQAQQGGRISSFTYDSRSRLATATDPLSRTTSFAYDSVGRITKQTLPDGREIAYSYDTNGNLSSLTPPGRPSHLFDYTAVNLTRRYLPPLLDGDTTATGYLYNLDRQITNTLRPDGINVSVQYDTVGCGTCGPTARPKTITFDRGELNFFYHPTTGLLSALTAPGGNTLSYTYDGSMPTSVQWSGEVSGTIGVTYDNDFRVTQQTVSGANAVNFEYDQDGLLTHAGAMTVTREPANGRITSTQLGNVTTSQTYNSAGELATYEAKFGATSLFTTSYQRDSLGRIAELLETVEGVTKKFNYVYDLAGRLSQVRRNDTTISVYTYHGNGNRLSHTTLTGTTTGTYDSQDRLVSYGAASYVYTANGELQAKIEGSDTTRYDYDAFGNLVQVRMPNGDVIEYLIDGQNRKVGKKANGVVVKRWLYEGQLRPVAELDSAGTVTSRYVYGARVNVPEYIIKGTVTYRVITDHLGSVRLVVDQTTGSIAQRMDYDEWGNDIADSNPDFTPFGFAGGIYEGETKLTRFGARDYDAEMGRWTATDPILFGGLDQNLYSYVSNDPVNRSDPKGLQFNPVTVGAQALLGTVDVAKAYLALHAYAYLSEPRKRLANYDKLFHCVGNCEAARRGLGGFIAAVTISELREQFQERLGDPRSECDADRAANAAGRKAANSNKTCLESCLEYVRKLPH